MILKNYCNTSINIDQNLNQKRFYRILFDIKHFTFEVITLIQPSPLFSNLIPLLFPSNWHVLTLISYSLDISSLILHVKSVQMSPLPTPTASSFANLHQTDLSPADSLLPSSFSSLNSNFLIHSSFLFSSHSIALHHIGNAAFNFVLLFQISYRHGNEFHWP